MCCYYCFSYGLFEVGRTVLLSKRIHVISITVESARRILRVELTGYLYEQPFYLLTVILFLF